MRDFVRELEQRLTALAIEPTLWPVPRPEFVVARPAAPVRALPQATLPARPRLRRPRFAFSAIASASVVLGSTVLVTGSSTDQLAILGTQTSEASELRSVPEIQHLGVDLGKAHVVHGAAGTAYVLTSTGGNICLVLPDPNVAPGDGYGSACQPQGAVERRGLLLEAVGVRRPGQTTHNAVGFVLPIGASHPLITEGASRRSPTVDHGVIAELTTGPAVLSYTLAASRHSVVLHGPFEGEGRILCDHRAHGGPRGLCP